jgi:HPt (histidine-containing phosphotransfer) domain-containing protein
MLGLAILSIFVLIVMTIIILEVRNERKYQEKRRKRRDGTTQKHEQIFPQDPLPVPEEKVPESKPEPIKKEKKLPHCTYPQFTHARLVEMGLSDEESKEFVQELIPQLEIQIPLIEEALSIPDFHQMERLTHSIKGSATNLGTGGISDLLVECNTYLKTGTDADIAQAYFEYLKHYTKELKEQYT